MWTEERIASLKSLWKDGCSAAVIGGELGGVTRNAVIGKLHRLGLRRADKDRAAARPRAAKPAQAAQACLRTRRCLPRRRKSTLLAQLGCAGVATALPARQAQPVLRGAPPDPFPLPPPNPPPQAGPEGAHDHPHRCGLLDLAQGHCRWPLGDPRSPEFFFCGGPTAGPLSYCASHARRAFQRASALNLRGIPAE